MIFVTVGTNEAPFDRLVRAIDRLPYDEILVQRGSSRVQPGKAECVDYLPFDDLVGRVRSAAAVITHAGVGSVVVALTNGKTPIVVPRLKRFHEAVDDHQLEFGRRLAASGLGILVEDPNQLPFQPLPPPGAAARAEPSSLARELREYVHSICGPLLAKS